jgi:hypothetical protein
LIDIHAYVVCAWVDPLTESMAIVVSFVPKLLIAKSLIDVLSKVVGSAEKLMFQNGSMN